MIRIRSLAVLLVLGVAALAGCTPTPEPTSTPTESATPTPTPEEPGIDRVELRSTGLELWSGDELESSIGWFDPVEESLATLTEVFGAEPEEVPYPGHIEAAPGTDYVWGGFTFRVQEFEPDPPLWSNVSVWIDAADVDGVALTAVGLAVGSPGAEVDELPRHDVYDAIHDAEQYVWVDATQPDPASDVELNFVMVVVDLDTERVLRFSGPTANYGV